MAIPSFQTARRGTGPLLLIGLLLGSLLPSFPAVEVPAIFSDGMVLQQGQKLPVWGRAKAGSTITVQLAGQTVTSQSGPDERWSVLLDPLPASSIPPTPLTLVISDGEQTITVSDVLVGEVWLCSGQSNMQWQVKQSLDGDLDPIIATPPLIRLYQVERRTAAEPRFSAEARWQSATPAAVAEFSAVAWIFGRDLQTALGVPVGLIHASWGGTPAISWTRPSAFAQHPLLQEKFREWEKGIADFPAKLAAWEKEVAQYREKNNLSADVKLNRQTHPDAPQRPAYDPENQNRPGSLALGMLAPIAPYAIRGAIWYQGESDAGWEPRRYDERLRVMVEDWRAWWQNPEMAFGVVQLASYMPAKDAPSDDPWPNLRESQRRFVLADPHAGLAVAIDAGEVDDIHPANKQVIGRRLARWALTDIYGKASLRGGPEPLSAEFGPQVTVTFSQTGRGLRAFNGAPLRGFTLAGADGIFFPAEAVIQGTDRIVVSAPEVPVPLHVRYAWQNNPAGANLVNQERLPAGPFELRANQTP